MTKCQVYESNSVFDLPIMTDEEWNKFPPEQQEKIAAFEKNLIKQLQKAFDDAAVK